MPVAEHKEWCSILRGQKEMDQRAAARAKTSWAFLPPTEHGCWPPPPASIDPAAVVFDW